MKKNIFFAIIAFAIIGCEKSQTTNEKVVSHEKLSTQRKVVNDEKNLNSEAKQKNTISKSESNKKLIEACLSTEGILQADISDKILTIKANISSEEANKLSKGMLSELSNYNNEINTVMVVDLDYNVVGYSKK